jgi:DNA-binding CsgD family transcriptional regulator
MFNVADLSADYRRPDSLGQPGVAMFNPRPGSDREDTWPAPSGGTSATVWRWLAATLDELDYGILLLSSGLSIAYVNYAAMVELDGTHPLQLVGGALRTRLLQDGAPLRNAVDQASTRGLRRLLTLGEREHQTSVSIVPLGHSGPDAGAVLIVLGKSAVCESLSMEGYARAHGLTCAETRVLIELARGARPSDIACALGVAISTIRTQIGSVRTKTGAPSIRALLRQLSVLPPLKGVLREALGGKALAGLHFLALLRTEVMAVPDTRATSERTRPACPMSHVPPGASPSREESELPRSFGRKAKLAVAELR